jgi:hypothetical protein
MNSIYSHFIYPGRILGMKPNVRVYEPLRDQGAYLSRYTKATKRTKLRKPLPAMAYTRCYAQNLFNPYFKILIWIEILFFPIVHIIIQIIRL